MRLHPILLVLLIAFPGALLAAEAAGASASPFMEDLVRLLTLRDYNTRVVLLGTMLYGVAAGISGTFLLLRKRSLLADSVSHATLPGICIAYLGALALGGTGRSLPLLMAGAAVTGTLGMLAVAGIRRASRVRDDAALAIVLSVFFGAGIALLGIAARTPGGSAAGLETFIYGKPSSMLRADAMLIAGLAAAVAIACGLLFKEFALLCFDEAFARTQGWPAGALDLTLMAIVVVVTVAGLQSIGLILVVALLVIPPAAARFWTWNLRRAVWIAGAIGGASGLLGSALSALLPDAPAGAVIVLTATGFFIVSLLFGPARGVVLRAWRHGAQRLRIGRQHVLRALYELEEQRQSKHTTLHDLLKMRSWSSTKLRVHLALARRAGLVRGSEGGHFALTAEGRERARRLIRNHRLWELYLIRYADIAPSHVDRDADTIEHVLGPEMVARLEQLLHGETEVVPQSPHVPGEGEGR